MAEELATAVETPVETPVETTESVETPESVEQPVEESQEASTSEGEESQESTESEPASWTKIKGHIETLKKTDPALAKEIRNLYWAQQALIKEFPGGLAEAKKAVQTLTEIGDLEQLNAQRQEWAEIDEKFANGDATVLEDFAKFNPEGFAKLIPASLDKLATIDRDTYNRTLSGIFVSTLDNWRFADNLERMAENLGRIVDQNGQPLCAREIQQLQSFAKNYEGLRELASKAPEKKVDAAADKIAQERTQIAQERQKIHGEYVARETETYAKGKYDSLIPAEARNQKLNLDAMKKSGAYDRMINEIDDAIAREIVKDKRARDIQGLIAAGKRQDAVKLSNSLFDGVAGKAVQKVIRGWATLINPAGPKATSKSVAPGSKPTPAGVKKLEGPPDVHLVDKSDPQWRFNYQNYSKATLTTGQRVSW